MHTIIVESLIQPNTAITFLIGRPHSIATETLLCSRQLVLANVLTANQNETVMRKGHICIAGQLSGVTAIEDQHIGVVCRESARLR